MKYKTDPNLGNKIHTNLVAAGIETPMHIRDSGTSLTPSAYSEIVESYERILHVLGMDQNDDSLSGTPSRLAKMYTDEIFYGLNYQLFPACTTVENKVGYDDVVAVTGIDVKSMCEHHLLPFIGTAKVSYIPGTKILGLSKFARVVDFFSRRPQIQERLTEQIALALVTILETNDIAVVIKADHYCMKLRGVESQNSFTITSRMMGKFRTVEALRQEFLKITEG